MKRGKILGVRIDPATGKPMKTKEENHFYICKACGSWVDYRDLAQVFDHEQPLPHPAEDMTQ